MLCQDVFILDHGLFGIWVWVGKRANDKERSEAMRNARGFVKKKKYPNETTVTKVIDGAEPIEFKMLFTSWKNKEELKGKPNNGNIPLLVLSQILEDSAQTFQIFQVRIKKTVTFNF